MPATALAATRRNPWGLARSRTIRMQAILSLQTVSVPLQTLGRQTAFQRKPNPSQSHALCRQTATAAMWRGRRRGSTDPYAVIIFFRLAQQIAQLENKPPVTLAAIAGWDQINRSAGNSGILACCTLLRDGHHTDTCRFVLVAPLAACFLAYFSDEVVPPHLRPAGLDIKHGCLQPYLIVQVGGKQCPHETPCSSSSTSSRCPCR